MGGLLTVMEERFQVMGVDVGVTLVGGSMPLLSRAQDLVEKLLTRGRSWGRAADLVCLDLLRAGAAGASVDVGGVLRAEGTGPNDGCWVIRIRHPLRTSVTTDLVLPRGAAATFERGDPDHPDRPATLAGVTVIAARAWQAELISDEVFEAGLSEGLFLLAATGVEGLIVDGHGCVYPTLGLDRFALVTEAPAGTRGAA
jgi:thiamine biosynthesis lipoprotein